MNKTEYLAQPKVAQFIEFLRRRLLSDDVQFAHAYEMETKGRSDATIPWSCDSIYDAFLKYDWRYSYQDPHTGEKHTGSSFEESEHVLSLLSKKLRTAVAERNSAEASYCCQMVLDWGGVLGSSKKGNKRKLESFDGALAGYLAETKLLFESHEARLTNKYLVSTEGQSFDVVMNAGFTKIYSILCEEFIIYDGRVGAALGLLVREFLEHQNDSKVLPDELVFHYGRAKNSKVKRNPSSRSLKFPGLSSSSPAHIRSNLKANWILQDLAREGVGKFSTLRDPLRGIEAALFMIGYRV